MPEIISSDDNAVDGVAETVATDNPAADSDASGAAEGITGEERAELERLRAIHKDERRWERRAKENFGDADRWRKFIEAATGSDQKPDEFDPQAELNKLRKDIEDERTERTRVEVARDKGVDPKYVSGKTVEEMKAAADGYLKDMQALIDAALKNATAPATESTSTVKGGDRVEGPKQITSEAELKELSPAEQMAAYKDGRLDKLLGRS